MKSSNIKLLVFLVVLVMCVATDVANATEMSKGPYLIYPDNNTQMTVLWQLSDALVGDCLLEWGTTEACEDDSEVVPVDNVTYQYEHTIGTGDDDALTPGTKYYYQVREGVESGDYHTGTFRTAPAVDAVNVKFLAYGDTRSYPVNHDAVCARMVETFTDDPEYQTFTLHSGDWVNQDTENDWTTMFFNRSFSNALEMQANLPIQGCMGNHEGQGTFCESVYGKYWPYIPDANPDNDDWYSFDYGPVHVVVINEYRHENWWGLTDTELNKVKQDLNGSTKQWKFIVLHAPGYSADGGGGHVNNGFVQNQLQQPCVDYGVDIVFAGHNHYYARCYVNGVRHITTGGGGAPLDEPDPDYDPSIVAVDESYHFCEIDIRDDILYFIARDKDGNIADTFVLAKVDIPETWAFYVKDSSDKVVAWFDNLGNIGLKGTLTTGVDTLNEDPDHDEFRVQNSGGTDVAIIDGTNGNMYIKGDLHQEQDMSQLSPEGFIIKNSDGEVVAYIDDSGDDSGHLYLQGARFDYPDP